MIVVGIDSAELCGIAVLNGDRLVKHGTAKILAAADIERCADGIAAYRPDLVAVENVFYSALTPGAVIPLAILVGRWLQTFEARGIRCELVLASRWQTEVLPITHRAKRAERKAAAVAFAAKTFGVDVTEDAADAIAIAVWASRHFGSITTACDPQEPRRTHACAPGEGSDFKLSGSGETRRSHTASAGDCPTAPPGPGSIHVQERPETGGRP